MATADGNGDLAAPRARLLAGAEVRGEMVAGTATDSRLGHLPVPLCGLAGRGPVPFPLYLRTSAETLVLYRDANTHLGEDQLERLFLEGVRELYICPADRDAQLRRVDTGLGESRGDRRVAVERRADVLHGVATMVAEEVMCRRLDRDGLQRMQRMMVGASSLMVREKAAFGALRGLLSASHSLAQHSVSVSFLSMGLARQMLSSDPTTLVHAGLAGMFHDIGRVGSEDLDHDPDHTERGHQLLRQFGLPPEVAEVALAHHERWDGTGFPRMHPHRRTGQRRTEQADFRRSAGRSSVPSLRRIRQRAS